MRVAALILQVLFLCIGITNAQAQSAQADTSLVGTWLVTVDGLPETRTLIIAAEGVNEGATLLSARYGITSQRQTPVEAKVVRIGATRQLVLTTQAATVLTAQEKPDGHFAGTFVVKSGKSYAVTVARVSVAQLADLSTQAQPASSH